ncbi:MbcA/ParS/Xre antitoxin family protein [Aeromonas eucrenophila]|uniref:Antitoxin Xre-like helix-turn-helix domain-containing protein n=1 Tax=Aeromonas eucrenophila TaxID=649 RepID=A0ABW0YFE4_9GAMM|nr:MbcA/ParS/Xre antitoxin family protein [Aeromonas eucrenophila]
MVATAQVSRRDNAIDPSKALPVVFRILDKWQCSTDEQLMLLGISSRSTLNKYKESSGGIRLGVDLQERMSYILNIHKSLRVLFSLDESIYGWVRKPNSHPFFAGRSAMDVMQGGRVADLYEVANRLHAWRGGMA